MLAGIGSNDVGGDGSGPVNQDIIDAEALQDIGYLLEGLGNLSHQLSNTINYIGDKKTQQAALTGKYD